MKFVKLAFLSFVLAILLNFFVGTALSATPKPTKMPLEVNSYELFWPIVAGKVEGDSLYSLKRLKEKIRGLLIFSNLRKAEYYAVLSQKRLVEFEKLALTDKDYENAAKTLNVLTTTQEKIVNYLELAKEERMDTTFSSQKVIDIFDREFALLQSIQTKIDGNQKQFLGKAISNLSSLLSKLN